MCIVKKQINLTLKLHYNSNSKKNNALYNVSSNCNNLHILNSPLNKLSNQYLFIFQPVIWEWFPLDIIKSLSPSLINLITGKKKNEIFFNVDFHLNANKLLCTLNSSCLDTIPPLSIVKSTNDHCVPQGVHLAAAVVHDPREPGVDGFGGVAVSISKKLFINPKQTQIKFYLLTCTDMRSQTWQSIQPNHKQMCVYLHHLLNDLFKVLVVSIVSRGSQDGAVVDLHESGDVAEACQGAVRAEHVSSNDHTSSELHTQHWCARYHGVAEKKFNIIN